MTDKGVPRRGVRVWLMYTWTAFSISVWLTLMLKSLATPHSIYELAVRILDFNRSDSENSVSKNVFCSSSYK